VKVLTFPGGIVVGHKLPEVVVDGKRLGATFHFDSRSLAYQVPGIDAEAVKSVLWTRQVPIFDQGQLGSCEGNAEAGCIGTSPIWDALQGQPHPPVNEDLAVNLYSAATHLDPFNGEYPPDDTGTDSTSVNKVAKSKALIGGYLNAASVNQLVAALQHGPVNCAYGWYSSFDDPPSSGVITIGSQAYVRGGHALCFRGVDVDKQQFLFDNSWSTSWGVNGSAYIGYATMDRLFNEGGEAVAPTPVTVTPAPTPAPVTDPADTALWQAVGQWAANGGVPRTRPDLIPVQANLLAWARAYKFYGN
jgi:hypothetical protein